MRHVGFTGARSGMTYEQRVALIDQLQDIDMGIGENSFTLHHGGCKGADAQAHDITAEMGCRIVVHPSNLIQWHAQLGWAMMELRGTKDPIERNHDIVDEIEELLATPSKMEEDDPRSGTWATIRYARKRGKRITVIFGDGSVGYEEARR